MVAAAILLAGLTLYRSEAADQEVASSLEALRHEIRGLRVSEMTSGPSAPDPAPVEARFSRSALPLLSDREEEPSTPPRAERIARPTDDRSEERRSARGWVVDEHARTGPGLSYAARDRLEYRRRASEPARQLRRLAMLESPEAEERANAVFGLDADDEVSELGQTVGQELRARQHVA